MLSLSPKMKYFSILAKKLMKNRNWTFPLEPYFTSQRDFVSNILSMILGQLEKKLNFLIWYSNMHSSFIFLWNWWMQNCDTLQTKVTFCIPHEERFSNLVLFSVHHYLVYMFDYFDAQWRAWCSLCVMESTHTIFLWPTEDAYVVT